MFTKLRMFQTFSLTLALVLAFAISTAAQTRIFNYQGSLTDGTTQANGTYQMEFRLFDTEKSGKPLQVISDDAVTVKNGVFKVSLNFTAANAFDGAAARYLEIAVRKSSEANYITLPSRQMISNSPYSVKTLSAGFNEESATPVNNIAPEDTLQTVVLTDRPTTAITYTAGQTIAGRTVTINKNFPDTKLRITYMETFQSINPVPAGGTSNGQLFITCDGSPTYGNPGIISTIVFPIANTGFLYGQANIVGYITNLPAGNHTISVMVASNSVVTFPRYQYVLEVEELHTRDSL